MGLHGVAGGNGATPTGRKRGETSFQTERGKEVKMALVGARSRRGDVGQRSKLNPKRKQTERPKTVAEAGGHRGASIEAETPWSGLEMSLVTPLVVEEGNIA